MYRQVMFSKQNKTKYKVYEHLMFTKPNFTGRQVMLSKQNKTYKYKFTDTTIKFTDTSLQTLQVYYTTSWQTP